MKTYFKTFAIITLSLLLTNCRKAPTSSPIKAFSLSSFIPFHPHARLPLPMRKSS